VAVVLVAVVAALGLVAAGAGDRGARGALGGPYDADTGFRPEVDGFSFPNYGDDDAPGGGEPARLDTRDLQRLFPDDDVCFSGTGDDCVLSPAGEKWLAVVNQAMDGGHCEGFAVLAARYHAGVAHPSDLQPGATTTADLDGTDPLVQKELAYWWATQAVAPTSTEMLARLSPNEALATLQAAMARPPSAANTYTLGMWDDAAGHAVNPVALQDRGDGVWWVLVYDNNHPGVLRPIEIDTRADTWRYDASTRPGRPEEVWSGDASSRTLDLTPVELRERPQVCPWCGAGVGTSSFLLAGEGSDQRALDVYVTDTNSGRRSGRIGGEIVEEIPGATVLVPTSSDPARSQPAPLIDAPAELNLRLTVTAPDDLVGTTDLEMVMLGAYDVHLDGLHLTAGQSSTLDLPADAGGVTLRSPGPTPLLTLGISPEDDPDAVYVVTVLGRDTAGPGELTVTGSHIDQLVVSSSVRATLEIGLELHRPDRPVARLAAEALLVPDADAHAELTTDESLFAWRGAASVAARIAPGDVPVAFTSPTG